MTFLAPLFLAATLAAAIPVILHMINRQKAKDLPFSTLRFLRISVQKTRRRRRIHDLLLMLIRMAALLLIALGLAKPTMTSLSALLGGGNASAVAIVLDNSASMGMVDENRPRFETALGAVQQILAEIKPRDKVALFLTNDPTENFKGVDEEKRGAFRDLGLLKTPDVVQQILNQCSVSYERADVGGRIQDARKELAKSDAPNKQIFVLTDQQKLSWDGMKKEDQDPQAEEQLSEEEKRGRKAAVIVVDCNRSPKSNQSIHSLEIEAAVPVAGLPIKATVDVFNAAPHPESRRVELYIDDVKEAGSPDLKIDAGSHIQYPFSFSFKRGGLHRGELRLVGEDGSKYDDRRFFTMEVDQGIPVAIVGPQKHEIAYLNDTFYVEQALSPARAGGWAIRGTTMTAKDLAAEPLNNYTVICCVNVPAFDAEMAEKLRAYVEAGGHLMWICGDNVDPKAYNQMNEEAKGQLLPAPLVDIRTANAAEGRESWHIAFLDKKHRALAQLIEPVSLYQSILVYKHARMDAGEKSGAWVMARLEDGEALLAQRNVQRGSVTMWGTSAHVGWSNFPLRPIFLPLLARLTFEMAGTEQTLHSALAGAPLVLQLEDETRSMTVEVVPPSGTLSRLPTKGDEGQHGQTFRYADTHDIGIYSLRLLEGARPKTVAFSVNIDPEEAIPTKIEEEDLRQRFGKTDLLIAENPEDLSATFKLMREGTSLWGTFLSLVLVALVFETFLANRLSPKQDEQELAHVPLGMRRLRKRAGTA